MSNPVIRSELSAQRFGAPPNPAIERALRWVTEHSGKNLTIADQGCGRLRHLRLLRGRFRTIVLVDTEEQLTRLTKIKGRRISVQEYVQGLRGGQNESLSVHTAAQFAGSRLELDCVLTVATFDVIPQAGRRGLVAAAYRNLKIGGHYIVIIPRNDASITRRCIEEKAFEDGYLFRHHGAATYFRNFRSTQDVAQELSGHPFRLVADLSRYRQACLVVEKSG